MSERDLETELEGLLDKLDASVEHVQRLVGRLAGAVEVARPEVEAAMEEALAAGAQTRELLKSHAHSAGIPLSPWADRQELEAAARSLSAELQRLAERRPRERLLALARELEKGRTRHRIASKARYLESLRARAHQEVERAASVPEGQTPPLIPGPEAPEESWLGWFWSLVEPRWSEVHESLQQHLPELAGFIFETEREWWEPESTPEPESIHEPASAPAPESPHAPESVPEPTEEPLAAAHVPPEPEMTPRPRRTIVLEFPRAPEVPQARVTPARPTGAPAALPGASQPRNALPEELQTFDKFRQSYWLDPQNVLRRAPWSDPDFAKQLLASSTQALIDCRLAHLWLFSSAARELGIQGAPALEDVEALAAIWARPDLETSGASEQRSIALVEQLNNATLTPSAATRLRVVLEALRPSGVLRMTLAQTDEVVDLASFQDPQLREVIRALLKLGFYVSTPIDLLRSAVQHAPTKSQDELRSDVQAARQKLHDEIKKLWSAAGGKIERTHCREAWTEFMGEARPLFDALSASAVPDATRRLSKLKETYEKIADRRGAKYEDRKRMDRALRSLVEAAQEVVQADRKLEAHEREVAPPALAVPIPLDLYNALSRSSALANPEEELFRRLLQRVVQGAHASAGAELSLTMRDFFERPSLLESVPRVSLPKESAGLDATVVEVRSIQSRVTAAATLMQERTVKEPLSAMMVSTLPRHLAEAGRNDLLIHIQSLPPQESLAANQALQDSQTRVYTLLTTATDRWHELSDVAHPIAPFFRQALEEIESLAQAEPPYRAKPELLASWMQRLDGAASEALGQSVNQLWLRAQGLPADKKAALEEALAARRLADALSLLGGETRLPLPGVRAVLSRPQARSRFPSPLEALLRYTGSGDELRNTWKEGLGSDAQEEKLRLALAHFVFDNRRTGRGTELRKRKRDVGVSCELVRRRIAEQGLNPSFVPQLARFREIVITTPPVPPTNNGFVNRTAEYISKFEHCISVVLVPRLPAQVRDELLHEFRRRSSIAAAIFDDLDLCRLLNPGGQLPNLTLGLIEIIFEQQRWRAFSPFEPQEGQHTKMEMYVGRSDEADKLFSSAGYSRLFSGRKLGKSALLKHVRDTQDGKKLPSGLTLRVLYVPAVGVDSEAGIVDQLEQSMRNELQFEFSSQGATPAARLSQTMERFLKERPTESLLIFLDEADAFVEEQNLAYDDRREQCLTWQMRTVIEAPKDKMDLPRVRFVFSGYRVTHRAEGAWANWGDVLRLRPLAPHEAAALIAGPLARLGIDAGHEAGAIAYRCGYQPAVLIKFGQQLLEHLESVTPAAKRDSVSITPEHVATVFASQPVQQEIRTVVWNNFQGNRQGRIIFSALLLEFSELAPGGVVDDAAMRVLRRLQQIAPGFTGFPPEEGASLDVISRHLRDFVGRSLLIESEPTTNSFQLKFPHHLPVLLQEDQTTAIQDQVSAISVSPPRKQDRVRSLLGGAVLSDLAYALEATETTGGLEVAAVIVCSQWAEAIEHPTGGVADRLGFEKGQLIDTARVDPLQRASEPRIALSAANPEVAVHVLSARPPKLPAPLFLGGADLLRWGLRQRAEEARIHEVAAVGRLTGLQIQWWFERVRGLEFTGRSRIGDILALTSGIPFLLGQLDKLFISRVGLDGANVSEREVEEVFHTFEQSFVRTVKDLQKGDPSVRLQQRELELLRIICRASQDTDDREAFIEAVMEGWSILYGSELALQAITDADAASLAVLQRLGLLPLRPDRNQALPLEHLAPLPRQDMLFRIVEALEA